MKSSIAGTRTKYLASNLSSCLLAKYSVLHVINSYSSKSFNFCYINEWDAYDIMSKAAVLYYIITKGI